MQENGETCERGKEAGKRKQELYNRFIICKTLLDSLRVHVLRFYIRNKLCKHRGEERAQIVISLQNVYVL